MWQAGSFTLFVHVTAKVNKKIHPFGQAGLRTLPRTSRALTTCSLKQLRLICTNYELSIHEVKAIEWLPAGACRKASKLQEQ